MLQLAITCLVIALIAALLGFGGIAGSFVGVAKILFFVFLVLAVLSFLGGGLRRGRFWGDSGTLEFSIPRCRNRERLRPNSRLGIAASLMRRPEAVHRNRFDTHT